MVSGAGAVGGFAIQLARLAGATVIATSSAKNKERALNLGAALTLDYQAENVTERLIELTGGRGVDGIIDSVSSDSATALLPALAHGGGLVCVAGRPRPHSIEPSALAPSIHEVALDAAYTHGSYQVRKALATDLATLLEQVAAGKLDAMLAQTLSFAEAPAAYQKLAAGQVQGKLVVSI